MDKGDDPYRILGLSKSDVDSDPSSVKKAYRVLARTHHPDKISGKDKDAAAHKFAKISHAYEVLREEESRRSYDLSQIHSSQKGYDPNGKTYFDSSTNNDNNSTKKKKNPTPVYDQSDQQAFSSRSASCTVPDKVSGKPKTFTYTTNSDGVTTVDVEPASGTPFSFSVSRTDEEKHNEVYELFLGQFGKDMADDFFSNDNGGGRSNVRTTNVRVAPEKKKKSKSKLKSSSKDPKEKRKSKSPVRSTSSRSPTRVTTSFNTSTPCATSSSPGYKTTNMKKPKQGKKKTPTTARSSFTSPSNPSMNTNVHLNDFDMDDENIESMAVRERTVINPKTNRKEVIVERVLTMVDGSTETHTERRRVK